MSTFAILTGSHAYGRPTPESDVDLVVFMRPGDARRLAVLMGVEREPGLPGDYPSTQFKAGKLNLIVETNPDLFECWRRGTEELVARGPVSRDEAVATFKHLRAEALRPASPEDLRLTAAPEPLRLPMRGEETPF